MENRPSRKRPLEEEVVSPFDIDGGERDHILRVTPQHQIVGLCEVYMRESWLPAKQIELSSDISFSQFCKLIADSFKVPLEHVVRDYFHVVPSSLTGES